MTEEKCFRCGGALAVARIPAAWKDGTGAILAHGAGQGMDSAFMSFFHAGLAEAGFLSVKFDFPYMQAGRRVPDPQTTLRATYLDVLETVLRLFGPRTLVAGGKSMGGRVASYIAGEVPAVRGLAFLGYPLHPPGRPDRLRDEHLYTLGKPMLFISGTRDTLAKRELLEDVVEKIGPGARVHWIESGDHSLRGGKKGPDRLPEALAVLTEWMRHLDGTT